jgi:threonine dehydrogenase-like Zn-dependent dehydrogenase
MADTMRAAVLHGINDLRVEQVPRARITRPDQALVKIGSVGICGSDLEAYRGDPGSSQP